MNAHADQRSYHRPYSSIWRIHGYVLPEHLTPFVVLIHETGVIKGSEQALSHSEGYLDKIAYCKLSHRTQATFANQRENIYKLFQAYLKRKKERGDYDAADRYVSLRPIDLANLLMLYAERTRSSIA